MHKSVYFVGLAGISTLAIWIFVVSPFLVNSNDFFEITAQNVGEIQFSETPGEQLSEPVPMIFDWKRNVIATEGENMIIKTEYEYRDILTEEVFWKTELEEKVDRFSREYQDKPGYFMFPTNLEKKDYAVYDVGGSVLSYKFEGEDAIDGLPVYKFSGQTTFDVSEIYPDLPGPVYEDYSATNYIDPKTGLEISFSERFSDYVIVNGEKVKILDAWSQSTPFSENILSAKGKQLGVLHDIYKIFIPITIIILTAGPCFTIALYSVNKRKQKQLQEELVKSEKFASLGQLSARLAHDIRNPLSVIRLTNDLLMNHSEISEKNKEKLQRIVSAVDRISNQTDDVMRFVRSSKSKRQDLALNQIIQQVISDTKVPEKIKIIDKTTDVNILVNEEEFYVLFHNLIRNSIEAIGNSEGEITIFQKIQKNNIEIHVQDSGPGIPDSTVHKIFDPLFTTKQGGTGLGLVSCKAIVKNHGGELIFRNNPSTFIITLALPALKNPNTMTQ